MAQATAQIKDISGFMQYYVDRLPREVGVLYYAGRDAVSWTGIVRSHCDASRCDYREYSEKAQVLPPQRPPHDSPISDLGANLSNKIAAASATLARGRVAPMGDHCRTRATKWGRSATAFGGAARVV